MKRTALLVLFVAGLLSACSTTRWISNPVTDQKDVKVSLAYQMKDGQVLPQSYDHPCTLDQQTLALFLKGLDYRDGGFLFGKTKTWPIFQADELARLVPAITGALAKADANQRIAFSSFNRGGEFVFKHRRVTRGILFVKPKNELNIAFSLIDYDLNPNRDYEIPADLLTRDPLTVRVSGISAVPKAPYAKYHVFADGSDSPVWIVANLKDLKAAARAESRSAGERMAAPAQNPPVETMEMRQERIQKRLEFLKGLYDKGLINEKEYDTKKNEVLNEIK